MPSDRQSIKSHRHPQWLFMLCLPCSRASGRWGVGSGGVDIHLYALCPPLQPSPSIHPSIPSLPPIPLILFPVPLALRSYLRSSALAIRLSPSPSPSLSLWRAPLPSPSLGSPPCADTLARAHAHTSSESEREEKKTGLPRTYLLLVAPPPLRPAPSPSPTRLGGAVSFTPRTVQERGGEAGLDIYLPV